MSFITFRLKPRTIEAQSVRSACAAIVLISGLLMAGCGDLEIKLPEKPAVRANGPVGTPLGVPSGSDIVYGEGATPANTAAALGSVGTPAQSQAERNRIARADLYYKLDWARTILESHSVPPELRRTVDQGRITMRGIPGGGGSVLLTAALTDYDKALELYEQQRDHQGPNPNDASGAVSKSATTGSVATSRKPVEPAKYSLTPVGEDPWPLFRSANQKLQEAGKMLGLTKDESGSFATDQFEKDPFDKNPFESQPPGR